jgi:hypothetical protein
VGAFGQVPRASRLDLPAHHPEVAALRVHDVVEDLPQVSPAAARALRERLASSAVDRGGERPPARSKDRAGTTELSFVDRTGVRPWSDRGGAEVGGGIAPQAFDDSESRRVLRRLEADPATPKHLRVAASRTVERLEGGRFVLSGPTPTGPIEGPANVRFAPISRYVGISAGPIARRWVPRSDPGPAISRLCVVSRRARAAPARWPLRSRRASRPPRSH